MESMARSSLTLDAKLGKTAGMGQYKTETRLFLKMGLQTSFLALLGGAWDESIFSIFLNVGNSGHGLLLARI
jgi:hypothetical protein